MCNEAIRIALKYEKEHCGARVRSRFRLLALSYHHLKKFGLHTHYILSACEVAYSVYRNKDWKVAPVVKRGFIKLDSQSYTLNHLILRIPTRPRQWVYITLQMSNHQLSFLEDRALKRGSVTVTGNSVSIALTKEVADVEPLGKVGIDVNERNATWTDSGGRTSKEDTSQVAEVKRRYREIRSKIASRTHKDGRVRLRLLSRYGKREKDRTISQLHRVTKKIVEHAKANRLCIVMENLNGIRKRYRRGNGQGRPYRGRMNSWTFREFQRQIEYKARWAGLPVTYVNPRGTSRKCPNCGSPLTELEGRKLLCPSCNQIEDRDVIASKNILACVVPQARPSA